MERKVNLLTCEAAVATYSGQMFVPQFQKWFSPLLWMSTTVSPPQFFKTRHWKTQKINNVNWYSFGCSWFFFLKGQWTTLAEEALSLNTYEPTSLLRGYSTNTEGRDGGSALWNFLNTHVILSNNFFLCWKLRVTLLGSKDSLRLSWEGLTDFPKDQRLQRCRTDVLKNKNGQNR